MHTHSYFKEKLTLNQLVFSYEMALMSFNFFVGITSSNAATCGLGAVQVQCENNLKSGFFFPPIFSCCKCNKDLYVFRS